MSAPFTSGKYFTPIRQKPRRIKLAAFDTEGNGRADGFVCAAVCAPSGNYVFESRRDALDFLLSPQFRGHYVFSHNLEYDLGVLTGGDLTPFRCLFSPAGLLWAEHYDNNRHKIMFVDSAKLFPGSTVADLGLMVGRAKIDLHHLLQSHINAGRPLAELEPDDRWRIKQYCLRDAEIVLDAVTMLQEELNRLGGKLKPTLAGCSLDLFRRKFMRRAWPTLDDDLNRIARHAYYGARTEPYRLGRVNGINAYDISSLYPSVMTGTKFPLPGSLSMEVSPANYYHLIERPGICQCTVSVPDIDPPLLPKRFNRHLYFPTGKMHGIWNNSELAHAVRLGCTIESVDYIIWTGSTYSPFDDFIETLYRQRVLHAQDSPAIEKIYKILLNSSYGRFGLNPDNELLELIPLTADTDFSKLAGAYFYELNGRPYALRPITDAETPPYVNTLIASEITAQARLKMYPYLAGNLANLCYTDTDSIWITSRIESKSGLGFMREEHKGIDLHITAPKEYAVFSGEHLIEAHAKGVPQEQMYNYIVRGLAHFARPRKLKESLRLGGGYSEWIEIKKERQIQTPKRAPDSEHRNGQGRYWTTRPWTAAELLDLSRLD